MPPEAATWHYIVAAFILALVGVVAHVVRAVVNLHPDRLSDRPLMDLVVSDGYNWNDLLFGTEYDDYGFYRLYSLKNLRISCSCCVAGGLGAMLLVPGASVAVAQLIDQGLVALKALWVYRVETFEWW